MIERAGEKAAQRGVLFVRVSRVTLSSIELGRLSTTGTGPSKGPSLSARVSVAETPFLR